MMPSGDSENSRRDAFTREASRWASSRSSMQRNRSDASGISRATGGTLGENLTSAGSYEIGEKVGAVENIVNMTNPLETEAETMILKALDRHEKNQNETAQNLLNAVPRDAVGIFRETNDESSAAPHGVDTNQSRQTSVKHGHNRTPTKTMEQILASLTDTLADIHQEIVDDMTVDRVDLVPQITSTIPVVASPGEQLAAAADIIFQGGRQTDTNPTDIADDKASAKSSGSLRRRSSTKEFNRLQSIRNFGRQPSTKTMQPSQGNQQIPDAIDILDSPEDDGDPEVGVPNLGADQAGDGDDGAKKKPERWRNMFQRARTDMVQNNVIRDFNGFIGKRQSTLRGHIRTIFLVGVPAAFAACILFYFAGNPPTGILSRRHSNFANGTLVTDDFKPIDAEQASYSWWIIFICIRQMLVFSLSHLIQMFLIDFLCLGSRTFVRLFGSLVTLFIVQSRGWPFILVVWGSLNFGLLHGKSSRFAAHWLFWQSWVGVFNEKNPSGTALSNSWYTKILIGAICVGAAVAVKRLWLGLYLGKKTYQDHASALTTAMSKVVMLCEVAAFARRCALKPTAAFQKIDNPTHERTSSEDMRILLRTPQTLEDQSNEGSEHIDGQSKSSRMEAIPEGIEHSENLGIQDLLGAWEDPALRDEVEDARDVTISSILQFRQSLAILSSDFVFSIAWGDCSTRECMVSSSRGVYKHLLTSTSDSETLRFSVLTNLCMRIDGSLDRDKATALIALLRPDREGNLTEVDFVRSVDSVYKEVKLLRATVRNSEKIDQALEKMINLGFFTILAVVVFWLLGFNPLTLFVSLSAPIVGFGFVLGGALSKMCEGWLFILIRRPYGIGDRIHVSAVDGDTNANGSASWIVEDVTLFHTVVVFGTTNERATIPNGSLAGHRVINMARSPNAIMYVHLRFGINVPYERIQVFESSVREFVRSRPREWARFEAFRPVLIAADQGYVEYKIVLTHRESWQQITRLLDSKAQVEAFSLELSKKLDIRYTSPPLPVDLAMVMRETESTSAPQIPPDRQNLGVDSGPSEVTKP